MKWQSDLPCWKRERTTCWRPKGNTIQWIVNFTIILRSPALKMAGKSSADPVQLTRNMTACLIKDIWDSMQHVYRVEGKYLQQQTFVKVIKICAGHLLSSYGWVDRMSCPLIRRLVVWSPPPLVPHIECPWQEAEPQIAPDAFTDLCTVWCESNNTSRERQAPNPHIWELLAVWFIFLKNK